MDAVYRLSFAILGDEADARDAAQETFVAAWRQLPRLRDADRFDAWLQRVAVNAARMTLRSRGRRRVREIPAVQVAALVDTAVAPADADRSRRARSGASRSSSARSSSCTTSMAGPWPNSPRSSDPGRDREVAAAYRPPGPPAIARRQGVRPMTNDPWDDERLEAAYAARGEVHPTAGDLTASTMAAIRSGARPATVSRWPQILAAAAAVAVVIGGLTLAGLGSQGPNPGATTTPSDAAGEASPRRRPSPGRPPCPPRPRSPA